MEMASYITYWVYSDVSYMDDDMDYSKVD